MPRAAIAGRKASAFGLTALVLLPVLLRAQAASARPPEKPRIVDMGTYQVDAPGKNWQIETMERDSAVMFSKFREGLLDYQGRVDMITVQSVIVNIYGWRSTEEEVIADYASRRGIAAMNPREGWEPFEWEGKKVRAIIGKGGGPEGKVKSIFLFHFPFDSRKSHRFFVISFISVSEALRFSGDPSQEPVRAVLRSLEISDPLRDISGPHGELVRAAAAGNAEGVARAIETGADLDAGGPGGSALSAAAFHGRREIVDMLLEKGARVDIPDAVGGATPLLSAIIGREPEIALLLVAKGADVNRRISAGGGSGVSALMFATAIGHLDLARSIIDAGAKLEARTALGETALILAAENGWSEGAGLLLERGADPNARMSDGWTALMRAADKNQPEVVKLLLEHGADPNYAGLKGGWTALMCAVRQDNPDVVKALIEHGADVNARADKDMTALTLAIGDRGAEIIEMLKAAGVKR